jgi:hypothetical protein
LEWIKFVAIFNDGKTVKKLPEGKPGGGRKEGRPRLTLMNDIGSDLIIMGVRTWKIGTVD